MSHPNEPWKPLGHFAACMAVCLLGAHLLTDGDRRSLYLPDLETLSLKLLPLGLLLYGVTAWFSKLYRSPLRGVTIAGAVYIALGVLSLVMTLVHGGQSFALLVLGTVWATDIGAYVTGRWLKGPRMAPRISPNKTWWGFWGGIFWAGCLNGVVWVLGVGTNWEISSRKYWWIFFSLAISLASHGGDLLESWAKRKFSVKDSGRLIPGHGGLLDRLDSLLAAAILVMLYWVYIVVGLLSGLLH